MILLNLQWSSYLRHSRVFSRRFVENDFVLEIIEIFFLMKLGKFSLVIPPVPDFFLSTSSTVVAYSSNKHVPVDI